MPHLFPWNALISKIWFLKKAPSEVAKVEKVEKPQNQNDENSKRKREKTRWNPTFGISDLENDLLTSTTLEGAQWFYSKITFINVVHQAKKNELFSLAF